MVAGAVTLTVGVVTAVTGSDAAIVIALLAIGLVLLVLGVTLPRLTRMKVDVPRVGLLLEAELAELEVQSSPSVIDGLRSARLDELSAMYSIVNKELRGDQYRAARIHLQDQLIDRAQALPREAVTHAALESALRSTSPALRAVALGVALRDPTAIDTESVVNSIRHPLSANEQYHALRLALEVLPTVTTEEVAELPAATRSLDDLSPSGDRSKVARRLLERIEPT